MFTDQKPFVVTQEDLDARWTLRCAWCGHTFKLGDSARWVCTNYGTKECDGISGNPFICQTCDGPRDEILARLRAMSAEFESDRFWWFRGRQ